MNVDNLDEVEKLAKQYKMIIEAKERVDGLLSDPDTSEPFALIDKSSRLIIYLPGLRGEILDAITDALNEQQDKAMTRLREL